METDTTRALEWMIGLPEITFLGSRTASTVRPGSALRPTPHGSAGQTVAEEAGHSWSLLYQRRRSVMASKHHSVFELLLLGA